MPRSEPTAARNKDTSGIRAAAIPTETPRTAASGGGDSAAAHPSDHTGFGDCGCDVCCPEPGPQEEIAKLKHAISGLIPWVAGSGRGAAQESLAEACELIGADPFMWSAHPDVLLRRRPDLERRKP